MHLDATLAAASQRRNEEPERSNSSGRLGRPDSGGRVLGAVNHATLAGYVTERGTVPGMHVMSPEATSSHTARAACQRVALLSPGLPYGARAPSWSSRLASYLPRINGVD